MKNLILIVMLCVFAACAVDDPAAASESTIESEMIFNGGFCDGSFWTAYWFDTDSGQYWEHTSWSRYCDDL